MRRRIPPRERSPVAADQLRASYFQAVGSISSDYDRRRVLIECWKPMGGSPETASRVGQSAKIDELDHDKAKCSSRFPSLSGGTGCALLKAARTIQSDHDKARVPNGTQGISSHRMRRGLFFAVVSLIQSDNDRSSVLRDMLDRPGLGASTYASVASAAKAMSSDNDKANVLTLLSKYYADSAVL